MTNQQHGSRNRPVRNGILNNGIDRGQRHCPGRDSRPRASIQAQTRFLDSAIAPNGLSARGRGNCRSQNATQQHPETD
jgi:hypothetical protein